LRAHPFVCLLALAAPGPTVTGAGAAAQAPVPAAHSHSAALPLVWIDGGRTSPLVLDHAEREASRIWAPAGITFDWARSTPTRAARPDEVMVMVRERLAGRPNTGLRVNRRHTLGRVILVTPDRPSRVIELLLPAVTTSVHGQTLFGQLIRDLPAASRERVLGRALGRVLAHEIGHWLFGRAHTPAGLMRASIKRTDLVGPITPALPADWPSRARGQLQSRRRASAPPCSVRQPVTEKGTVSCP
jgi:hypothetical protein